MSQDGFSKRGCVLLNKRKLVKLAQKIACAAGAILLSFLCIVPTFASTGYENLPTDNQYEVSLTENPFLSLRFAVSGEEGMSAQGFFRLKRELFGLREYSFIIAEGSTYVIGYRASDGTWYSYIPDASEALYFRLEHGRLPTGENVTEEVIYTIALYCRSGRIETENNPNYKTNAEFLMKFNCATVPITSYGDGTYYIRYENAHGYRNAFGDDQYIYTRAPLGSIRIGSGGVNETLNNLRDLHINFYMPFDGMYDTTDEGDLTFRLGSLIDMVNFDYGMLPRTNWDYIYRPAWYFTFGNEFTSIGLERGLSIGFDNGFMEGKQIGYQEGLKTADLGNVGSLMSGIFEGIYNVFNAILDFNIPIGNSVINFAQIAGMLIALVLIIIVVRFILR